MTKTKRGGVRPGAGKPTHYPGKAHLVTVRLSSEAHAALVNLSDADFDGNVSSGVEFAIRKSCRLSTESDL